MKRVFGFIEVVFDVLYLLTAVIIGLFLLFNSQENIPRTLAGIMALILVGGDAFHLFPRIQLILTQKEEKLKRVLGRGKQITSVTMTVFYILLWHIGLYLFSPSSIFVWTFIIYLLSLIRIVLCLIPHNKWEDRYPPIKWGIYRNIPFLFQGVLVAGLFFVYREFQQGISMVWLAVILSFVFYLPVVLLANKKPKIGMLMLPKTAIYVWILIMSLSL